MSQRGIRASSNKIRTSLLDDLGDLNAPEGSLSWAKGIVDEIIEHLKKTNEEATFVGCWLKTARDKKVWQSLELLSFDVFCRQELNITETEAEALIQAKPGQKIGYVIALANKAKPSLDHSPGRPLKNKSTIIVDLSTGGNDRVTAQIAKRRPDILKRMKQGEFKSVRAAAEKAGVLKPMAYLAKTKENFVRYIKKHFSVADIRWIKDQL